MCIILVYLLLLLITYHLIYISIQAYDDGFCFGRCYITESVYVGLVFLLYYFISYSHFLVCEVAGVFCHNFVIWIYGVFRILFPFRIENIGLCEFECCYLILLCSRIGELSLECATVFCWDITFKVNALAVSFGYWSNKATAVRRKSQCQIAHDAKFSVKGHSVFTEPPRFH